MSDTTQILIVIVICMFQHFLSSRGSAYLGAIIPIGYITALTWMFSTHKIESTAIFVGLLIAGLLVLIEEWVRGQKSFKKKRQDELDKMRSHDI